jgi:hypothetical protein
MTKPTPDNYLFDNAVIDRYARMANGLPVEPEVEFADRLLVLASIPPGGIQLDVEHLDSFLERKRAWGAS